MVTEARERNKLFIPIIENMGYKEIDKTAIAAQLSGEIESWVKHHVPNEENPMTRDQLAGLVEHLGAGHKEQLDILLDDVDDRQKYPERVAIQLCKGSKDKNIPVVWLLVWRPGEETEIHDHCQSEAAFHVYEGKVTETVILAPEDYEQKSKSAEGVPVMTARRVLQKGETMTIPAPWVHVVGKFVDQNKRAVTIHAYSPCLTDMNYYQLTDGNILHHIGAWADNG